MTAPVNAGKLDFKKPENQSLMENPCRVSGDNVGFRLGYQKLVYERQPIPV